MKLPLLKTGFATRHTTLKPRAGFARSAVTALSLGLGLGAFLIASPSFAQTYPDKPIKIVVGFSPGGFTDVLARVIAKKLSAPLGQAIIVENRPGATGTIAADFVAKSKPDGYTILMGHFGSNAVAPAMYPKLSYDVIRDFTPIVLVASTPVLLTTHPSIPAKDVKAFIAYAKQNPDKLSFSSSGNGTAQHLAGVQFMQATQTQMTHIPYKGSAAAISDLLGGQVQLSFESPPNVLPHIRAGKLNVLAVSSLKRLPLLPEVPTLDEAGLAKFEMNQWFGIFAPAKLPAAISLRLNTEINAILKSPDVVEMIAAQGGEIAGGNASDFSSFLQTDVAKWARVVKAAGITAE